MVKPPSKKGLPKKFNAGAENKNPFTKIGQDCHAPTNFDIAINQMVFVKMMHLLIPSFGFSTRKSYYTRNFNTMNFVLGAVHKLRKAIFQIFEPPSPPL